jgi:membrane-bound serine protease (ClpP class)
MVRLAFCASALLAGLILALFPQAGRSQDERSTGGTALIADINGPIGPAATSFITKAIDEAGARNAEILILRIDTPGGLATSMRDIIREILASPVPVVGYVAPPGARAASAGTYILYATHVAAMAPGTNLGAATPVQIGGGGFPGLPSPTEGEKKKKPGDGDEASKEEEAAPADPMKLKTVNDAVAFIRSLAELRGRNADWAEEAVRKAASLPARQALEKNVIDLVAQDTGELLTALDGRTVSVGREERTLSTAKLHIERLEPDFITELLGILANPNVALILMMIGAYGLIFELATPGSIGPGVVGVICLVLGLYALNQLPLNYAGLALVFVGIGLMVAEALSPSFGVLGTGGIIAFVIGAAMLIDTDVPAFQVSWSVIASIAVITGLTLILLLGYVWRSLRRPAASGSDAMVGESVEVLDWSEGEGHVWAAGERWNARADRHVFEEGEMARVRAVEGITLKVAPLRRGRRKPGGGKRSRKGA